MFFEVRAPQDEAKIVPNRLSEPLSSDFEGEKSFEEPLGRPVELLRAPRSLEVPVGGPVGRPGRPTRLRWA